MINNFKFENLENLKDIDSISFPGLRAVTFYCMIKNNKRLYQMAYTKDKINNDRYSYTIVIYNLMSKKTENKISGNGICLSIKHYFNPSTKNHFLLSSVSYRDLHNYYYEYIKLWNISSNPIINILTISGEEKKNLTGKACLLFTNESFLIFGEFQNEKIGIWNQSGKFLHNIQNSNINNIDGNIEAAYFEDKSYILLSGRDSKLHYSECYNYDEDTIKTYNDNNNSSINCMKLFKKEKNIYLITASNKGINVFDFFTTKLKKVIQLGNNVFSLCSISEKYIIASSDYKLKIIDMDNYSVVKTYSEYPEYYEGDKIEIIGMEKIKIPEKGEYLITYSAGFIKIWKL